MNRINDLFQKIKGKKFCRMFYCFRLAEKNGLSINSFYVPMGFCKFHSEIAKEIVAEIIQPND